MNAKNSICCGYLGRVTFSRLDVTGPALAVLFPSKAGKVRLLNGDMVTPGAFDARMEWIDTRLAEMARSWSGSRGG